MGVNVSYMGTKRELLDFVSEAVESTRDGIFLDAFSGMCSVGEKIGTQRQVWCNDTQVFASQVARALFTSREAPIGALAAAEKVFPKFSAHRSALSGLVPHSLEAELAYQAADTFESSEIPFAQMRRTLELHPELLKNRKFVLFTRLYANSYIGVRQAVEMDSIIAALHATRHSGVVSSEQHRWLTLALGRAVLKCSATTGHFAQYLTPNKNSYKKLIKQRTKSIWSEWLHSIDLLAAVGDEEWRSKNQVFNEDSRDLVRRLDGAQTIPSVIYADPPYTDDQYSRFYHLLDTLLLYDYPKISGKGRYRAGRFHTSFSLLSTVHAAFTDLLEGVAALGADLVLSYPSNGLLHKAGHDPLAMMRTYFDSADCFHKIPHTHSTMGASKGSVTENVMESIYVARV